jgi:hypothetical protein
MFQNRCPLGPRNSYMPSKNTPLDLQNHPTRPETDPIQPICRPNFVNTCFFPAIHKLWDLEIQILNESQSQSQRRTTTMLPIHTASNFNDFCENLAISNRTICKIPVAFNDIHPSNVFLGLPTLARVPRLTMSIRQHASGSVIQVICPCSRTHHIKQMCTCIDTCRMCSRTSDGIYPPFRNRTYIATNTVEVNAFQVLLMCQPYAVCCKYVCALYDCINHGTNRNEACRSAAVQHSFAMLCRRICHIATEKHHNRQHMDARESTYITGIHSR